MGITMRRLLVNTGLDNPGKSFDTTPSRARYGMDIICEFVEEQGNVFILNPHVGRLNVILAPS